MTDQHQPRQSSPDTDATALPGGLESLGFSFTEDSPVTEPVETPREASEAVPLSRRALREAEKKSSTRRGRGANPRAEPAETPSAAQAPVDPADIATAPLEAIEPAATEPVVIEPVASATGAPQVDHPAASRGRRAHEARSVLRRPAPAAPAPLPSTATTSGPTVSLRRRVAQRAFPPVVMAAAAALLIGTSVPPSALFDPDAPPASAAFASVPTNDATMADDGTEILAEAELEEGQVLDMAAMAEVAAPVASRDDWSVTSYAEMLRLKYGTRNFSYATNGTGAVRWPFPNPVPISSGFGDRVAPCFGCSSYHRGLDMLGGRGNPIYAIADGVVTGVGQYTSYGYRVEISHMINGQRVTSLYAHMEWDSSPLKVGQEIPVGTLVGTVGNSGLSTGPHLHLEIAIDGIAIDPFAWLTTNAS